MLKVEKVQYLIIWKGFEKGASFFIPCLDPAKSKKVIVKETRKRKYTVTTKIVIEDDVRGIRVWRV
jgi:hypothetical protein